MMLVLRTIIKLARIFIRIKKKTIIYHSFPDFSDNSFAAFVYISNHHKEYRHVWLVDNYSLKNMFLKLVLNYTNSDNLLIVRKKSIAGLYYYFTGEFVFFTHAIFDFLQLLPGQIKVNLWHGMPLKKIGFSNNTVPPVADYIVATSSFYKEIMSEAFKVSSDKILNVGQPRNDFLFEHKTSINKIFNNQDNFKSTILWMPTYRKSIIKDMKEIDGIAKPHYDFLSQGNLSIFNNFLNQSNSICYIKTHPMDIRKVSDFNKYSNIQFIDNSNFNEKSITMYSVFNSIDILLTDFSSIYVDFLLLNKPIGFVFSDFDEYKNSRGFLFSEPEKYMPGPKITSMEDLKDFLSEIIIRNNDKYCNERETLKKLFHNNEKNFSEGLSKKLFYN